MPVSNGLPNLNERVALSGYLAAGPAAGGATTEQAFASAERACRIIQAFIFPSADIAADAADPSTLTVQVGATVIATGTNAAAVTAAAGLELTITAANADIAAGDVVKVVADNGGAAGAQDLSGTGFNVELITRVA